jgi:hypothetical protein
MKKKLTVIITNCLQCPEWAKCEASRKLNQKERFIMSVGIGAPNILPNCPLEDYKENDRT